MGMRLINTYQVKNHLLQTTKFSIHKVNEASFKECIAKPLTEVSPLDETILNVKKCSYPSCRRQLRWIQWKDNYEGIVRTRRSLDNKT